jgi:hypothetical protein
LKQMMLLKRRLLLAWWILQKRRSFLKRNAFVRMCFLSQNEEICLLTHFFLFLTNTRNSLIFFHSITSNELGHGLPFNFNFCC